MARAIPKLFNPVLVRGGLLLIWLLILKQLCIYLHLPIFYSLWYGHKYAYIVYIYRASNYNGRRLFGANVVLLYRVLWMEETEIWHEKSCVKFFLDHTDQNSINQPFIAESRPS